MRPARSRAAVMTAAHSVNVTSTTATPRERGIGGATSSTSTSATRGVASSGSAFAGSSTNGVRGLSGSGSTPTRVGFRRGSTADMGCERSSSGTKASASSSLSAGRPPPAVTSRGSVGSSTSSRRGIRRTRTRGVASGGATVQRRFSRTWLVPRPKRVSVPERGVSAQRRGTCTIHTHAIRGVRWRDRGDCARRNAPRSNGTAAISGHHNAGGARRAGRPLYIAPEARASPSLQRREPHRRSRGASLTAQWADLRSCLADWAAS